MDPRREIPNPTPEVPGDGPAPTARRGRRPLSPFRPAYALRPPGLAGLAGRHGGRGPAPAGPGPVLRHPGSGPFRRAGRGPAAGDPGEAPSDPGGRLLGPG